MAKITLTSHTMQVVRIHQKSYQFPWKIPNYITLVEKYIQPRCSLPVGSKFLNNIFGYYSNSK